MALYRYIPTIQWKVYALITIPFFVGHVKIKHKSNRLYSERYGGMPNIVIGAVCISWVKWK